MSNPRLAQAHRRASAAQRAAASARAFLAAIGRWLGKDLLTTALLVASVVLAILFFSLLGSLKPRASGQEVPITQVSQQAKDKLLRHVTLLDQDHQVEATTLTGTELYANYPASDAATQKLIDRFQAAGVPVDVDLQSAKPAKRIVIQFLVPIMLLVCLFAFFTRLGQDGGASGIASFSAFAGKGRKKKRKGTSPFTFASVAGAPEALVELQEIRDFLANPSKYLDAGAAAPKGVLLVGPPGTGKTLLARATAGEAEATFYTASGAEFVESLVGVGAARVRSLFATARKNAPAIIFIDELDAAGRKRGAGVGQGNDEREQTLNQLLVEMDGFGGDAGVVVMGATNRPDILDPALLRPGRFDRQVVVNVPDVHGRREILELHGRGRRFTGDVDLMEIAKLTPGFSGAELANVVNEAALLAVREGLGEIDQHLLEEAIDRVVSGPAKKHILTEDERWLIAVHEASHAVAVRATGQVVRAQKLSIVARGRQLGTAASQMEDKDAVIKLREDFERQMVSIMAGVAGEVIMFGQVSSTISDDLHAATKLARSMVTSYGMSERLGRVTIGEPGGEVFLGNALQDLGSIGPHTLDVIDDETERIVARAEAQATIVLRRNWSAVQETAQALLEQETLSGMALDAVLSTVASLTLDELDVPEDTRRSPDGPSEDTSRARR